MLFPEVISLQFSMTEVSNVFNNFINPPSESEEGNPMFFSLLLNIDESVTKYRIDFFRDVFKSERKRCVVEICLGYGSSSDKKALYESDM